MWVSTRFQCTTVSVGFDRKKKKNQRSERGFCRSDLLIDKSGVFGFNEKSPAFISAYLKNRKQRTKVGSAFSVSFFIIHRGHT